MPAGGAATVSLIAAALFVGSVAAQRLAPLAGQLWWATVCGVGVTLAAGFGVAATLGSARSLREAATNA